MLELQIYDMVLEYLYIIKKKPRI